LNHPRLRRAAAFLGLSLLFALIYSQAPLYSSNQHQYFLHGLARAGLGELRSDWLANTRDPAPAFSVLVLATARLLPREAFYLEYALVMGVYLFALLSILRSLKLLPEGAAGRGAVVAVLLLLHSAALRFALSRGIGPEWEYALEAGVAGQRLLGPVFQPSALGVLLVVSLADLLRGRPVPAAAWAAAAAILHPTYLLSSAVLVLGYVILTARVPGGAWRALAAGAAALALVAPTAAYVYVQFRPTGPDLFAMSQSILVARLPHHALPQEWFGPPALAAIALVALGARRVRRTPLFPLLVGMAGFAAAGALVQVLSGSRPLGLLFPWRISALLVPVSSSILAASVLRAGFESASPSLRRLVPVLATIAVTALAVGGAIRFAIELDQMREDPARPMYEFVRSHRQPGQVYFIPPKLDAFRLETGAPIVADAKSIPYHDVEVVEWSERLRLAGFFFRDQVDYMSCDPLEEARTAYGATHFVLGPEQLGFECPGWRELYRDDAYAVYARDRR
jgi:hypothetical protein